MVPGSRTDSTDAAPAWSGWRLLPLDRLSAPFLRNNVGQCLREGPLVAFKVLDGVLTFAKGHVSWLHENASSGGSSPFTVRTGIRHPYQDRVRHLTGSWWGAVSAFVSDNDRAIAELKLRPMVLANLHTLDESECVGQPSHSRSNI